MGKKLLFVYYQNIKSGGVAKVLSNLVNQLVNEVYEVDILFLMQKHDDFYPIDDRVTKYYLDSFSYWTWSICKFNKKRLGFVPKIDNVNTYIYQLGVMLLMNQWLKENHKNYDNIISCWYKLSCTLSLNKKLRHKTIAWEHTNHLVGGALYNKLKRNYKNLKQVVCLNQDDFNYYKTINPKSTVIANMMGDETERQTFTPVGSKENLITMVARLDQDKNVLEFLEIIKTTDLPKDWKVEIIGDGPEMPLLNNYITINSLENVSLLGQMSSEDVKQILSKSKINCLTSLREGFGVVLIEAMFASNALISYDCPSGPSEIVNSKNGFLIPLKNKNEFENKLKYLIENPTFLENLMESSFRESEKWRKESIIDKWKAIFDH